MSELEAEKLLKHYRLKATTGREALVRALLEADKPLSHKELMNRLSNLQYDPASIYRSLDTFVEAGLVHRVEDENRTWLFALCTCSGENHCHPHFFCRSCGKCECLKDYHVPEIPGLRENYLVEGKRFYLKGICSGCISGNK
ncbi:MAG: Fur family transcriptional regulator [Bacillota bacterium]|nr:Fur family transcriptional regulator [Bacillota bacterium]